MITEKLLRQYKEYKGDLDAWSRHSDVSYYADWQLLASLLQNLWLIKNNKAGAELVDVTNRLINENLETPEAVRILHSLVG